MKKYIYYTDNANTGLLNPEIIYNLLNKFWKDVIEQARVNDNQKINIKIKIGFKVENNVRKYSWINLTRSSIIIPQNLDLLKGIVINSFEYHSDLIDQILPDQILILYSILPSPKEEISNKGNTSFRILKIRIPMTMDLSKWGTQFYSHENIIWIKKKNSKYIYKIIQSDLINKVDVVYSNKNQSVLSFIDTRTNGDDTFTRSLPNGKFYYFHEGIKIKIN
jgi:hypothetical protein